MSKLILTMNDLQTLWDSSRLRGVTHAELNHALLQSKILFCAPSQVPDHRNDCRKKTILLGVASYSEHDLMFLSLFDQLLDRAGERLPKIVAFSLDSLTSPPSIEQLIPGLQDAQASPVVGIIEGGKVVESGYGWPAKALLCQHLTGIVDQRELDVLVRSNVWNSSPSP